MNPGDRKTLTTFSGGSIEAEYIDHDNSPTGGWVFKLKDASSGLERHVTIDVEFGARKLAEAKSLKQAVDVLAWTYLREAVKSGQLCLSSEWDPTNRRRFQVEMGDVDRLIFKSRSEP